MAQKVKQEKNSVQDENVLARAQRQELKDELTENFAQRPRLPKNRQRIITFSVLGIVALLVAVFGVFILLPSSAQQPRGGVAVGALAPGFQLPIEGGPGQGSIDLSALRGHPVVLNFWSESCQPCLSEVPYLRDLYAQYGPDKPFTLAGVDQDDPRGDIGTFAKDYNINYPLLYDANSTINIAYGVTSLPMTYFIGSDGRVRYVVPQQLTSQAMQQGLAAIGVNLP